jgi:Domain of unknown function (DUF5658)
MSTSLPPSSDDWVAQQVQGGAPGALGAGDERRNRPDRRQRILWSVVYGSFRPRRRNPPRRTDEVRFHGVDWHSPQLWAVSVGILILSVADAFLTVTLMSGGAVEVNPLMAVVVGRNVALFAGLKMAITGVGLMLMVFLARYRFLRLVRVEVILYCILVVYVMLIGHEIGMLRQLVGAHLVRI